MRKQDLIAIIILSIGMALFAGLYTMEKEMNCCEYFVDHMDTKCLSIMLNRLGEQNNGKTTSNGPDSDL